MITKNHRNQKNHRSDNMKRIAIDMDGVMADVTAKFIAHHNKTMPTHITEKEVQGKSELEAFPIFHDWVDIAGFFRDMPLITDSQAIVAALNQKYEVFIVSAANEFPKSLIDKHDWLKEFFPFISWRQMVFCGSKTIVQADIMIDDHFKNLDYFSGQTLLFTAHHNVFADAGRHTRVNNWQEIAGFLL
jgi:5'(3')-deoxyribonucleotidase